MADAQVPITNLNGDLPFSTRATPPARHRAPGAGSSGSEGTGGWGRMAFVAAMRSGGERLVPRTRMSW
jgi:hypothetical protein